MMDFDAIADFSVVSIGAVILMPNPSATRASSAT
jgi:hypothetical protein